MTHLYNMYTGICTPQAWGRLVACNSSYVVRKAPGGVWALREHSDSLEQDQQMDHDIIGQIVNPQLIFNKRWYYQYNFSIVGVNSRNEILATFDECSDVNDMHSEIWLLIPVP